MIFGSDIIKNMKGNTKKEERISKIKKDQKMLSKFIKELKTKELSREVEQWWINRY